MTRSRRQSQNKLSLRMPPEIAPLLNKAGLSTMVPEQRKLAAILAADVVGYSRLMGRDESGTLARLQVF
jgi:class 3 adenylate cyclase